MSALKTLALLTILLAGCSAPAAHDAIELEPGAGSAGVAEHEAGSPGVIEAGSSAGGSAGEAGSMAVGEAGSEVSGGAPEAGSSSGGTAGASGSPTVAGAGGYVAGSGGALEGGNGGTAGQALGGSAGAALGGAGGSAGSAQAGSSSGGATAGSAGAGGSSAGSSGGAGAPGTECPYHVSSESISAQYGHTITETFPSVTYIAAVDLTPLAGYLVTPFVDGVQSAKAFAGGSVWVIPPVNKMKILSFVITPYTAAPLMPPEGLVLWCK